jgi:hypothetical protein
MFYQPVSEPFLKSPEGVCISWFIASKSGFLRQESRFSGQKSARFKLEKQLRTSPRACPVAHS